MWGGVPDVINPAKFFENRPKGFGAGRPRNLAFPIDFAGRPYNTLTLPCEVWYLLHCIISTIHGCINKYLTVLSLSYKPHFEIMYMILEKVTNSEKNSYYPGLPVFSEILGHTGAGLTTDWIPFTLQSECQSIERRNTSKPVRLYYVRQCWRQKG